MAAVPQVYYYYKQDTNQILAGSADGSITTVGEMNALLTSSKNTPLTDINTIAKIKSIGQAITYKSDVVYNSASAGYGGIEGFEIPIQDDQELWVYRGIQPVDTVPSNTPSNAGPGDSNHTQYNAYLHRPYKLYMLTETGSGVGTKPWLPLGEPIDTGTTGNGLTLLTQGTTAYNIKQQGIVGNLDYPNNNFLVSQSLDSGSFNILQGNKEIHPWVETSYISLGAPPVVGSQWFIYLESSSAANYGQSRIWDRGWKTATGGGNPGELFVASNNSNASSVTSITIGRGSNTPGTTSQILSISQSGNVSKPMGQVKLTDVLTPANYAYYSITAISSIPARYFDLTVNTPDIGGTWPPANDANISMSFTGTELVATLSQIQNTYTNTQPTLYDQISLNNGSYTFTSSNFDTIGGDGAGATGSCQFGLYSTLDDYVEYKVTVDITNVGDVRIDYTGSTGNPNYSLISPGYNSTFIAIPGTVSASNNDSSTTYQLETINNSAVGATPVDVYSTRLSDVYLSLSSSLSQSIDGLYIFNQLPSDDIYVTASMLLNAWTGSDDGAKYGDVTYALSGNPVYGEGEAGDGTSWPTASINIYKGNYPASVPTEISTPLHTEQFITLNGEYGNNGVAITTSFVLPSSSISFQDCINLSLSVTSGSDLSTMVENSLVVSEYTLEFNNAASQEGGDGRVPTFIDNSFRGTQGFSNAPDCQPMLNNVLQERNNPNIQLVEYSTDPYDPSNFQQILSGSAQRSTVPVSNYYQDSWLNNRYDGSRTSAYFLNSIIGLDNGFGKSPVIDYKRAYLGYCNQVTDPYPVVNNKTQFNILYLINGGGDALNPLISEYTAFDVLGTWDEGGMSQIGINQISGSTQFDALNGYQSTFKVGKEAIPLLYSQISAVTYSGVIPIAGNAQQISNVTSSYIEYDMSAQGSSTIPEYQQDRIVTYYNIAQGIADQQVAIFPQNNGDFDSDDFTYTTGSGFGVWRKNPADVPGVIELPIITSSIGAYTPPSDVFGAEYFGNPGEIFFTSDPLAPDNGVNITGSALSDSYQIRGTFTLPSTYPSGYKTKKFIKKVNNKKTKYDQGDVGDVNLYFESTTQTDLSLGGAQWDREPFSWLSNNSGNGYQEPTMTFYFGNSPGVTNGNTLSVPLWSLSSDQGFIPGSNNSRYHYSVESDKIANYLQNNGEDRTNVQYITYDFAFQSNNILRSNTRYRFRFTGQYEQENSTQTGEPQINVFNPLYLPLHGSGSTGGTENDRISFSTDLPTKGPYVSLNVVGSQVASDLQSNALNEPFWAFETGSNASNSFGMDVTSNSTPYSQTSTIGDPTTGKIYFNNGSGSLRRYPNNSVTWLDSVTGTLPTTSQPGTGPIQPVITTGDGSGPLFYMSSDGNTITNIWIEPSTLGQNFKPGDVLTFPKQRLEDPFFTNFGTVSGDLTLTLTSDYVINNQRGSSEIAISTTSTTAQSLQTFINNLVNIGSSNDQGKIQISQVLNPNQQWTGSIASVTDNTGWATINLDPNNISSNNNPFPSGFNLAISFTTGSDASVNIDNTIIELQSVNGNNSYGLGYYQGYLPYEPGVNNNFPGGFEPQDTAWPLPNTPYSLQLNDEIRFENSEEKAFKIIKILSPEQNFIINGKNKLQLTVASITGPNTGIDPSTNLDFFLIRRYIKSSQTVMIDRVFPYGSLPTVKEFVPSTNNVLSYLPSGASGSEALGSTTTMEQSGSFIEYIKPLLKSDNTPSGIILPEWPITELEVAPDSVIRDLRDKKLIE